MSATESEATQEARRYLEVCNACRYCEGYCAVFPAMTLRREFSTGDMQHLANLCHGCKGCYHSCQYAPPHAFGINLPSSFATIRNESYEQYAWPPAMGAVFQRNGTIVSLVAALGIALALVLVAAIQDPGVLYGAHAGPGAFYKVIPWWLMTALAGGSLGFSVLALTIGAVRYWRGTGSKPGPVLMPAAEATVDILTLRNLGGGGHGCNDTDEGFSTHRRWSHQALMYGFLLCFASTSVATLYDHFLHLEAPYAFLSIPVQLGSWGGVLMLLGVAGLTWVKIVTDPVPVAKHLAGGEFALLALLFLVAATGLLLLAIRHTGAMGVLLAIHLGLVLSLFITLPYSKMVHGLYRGLALYRSAREKRTMQASSSD
jgi:citrate/tricarballylate utilization protein